MKTLHGYPAHDRVDMPLTAAEVHNSFDAVCICGIEDKATLMRCTRSINHQGPHVASGETDVLAAWPNSATGDAK